jgi:hypothetical protein
MAPTGRQISFPDPPYRSFTLKPLFFEGLGVVVQSIQSIFSLSSPFIPQALADVLGINLRIISYPIPSSGKHSYLAQAKRGLGSQNSQEKIIPLAYK